MSQKPYVYADNAATTMLSPKALEAMLPWLGESYGNASSAYGKGRESRRAVEAARRQTAAGLNASEPGEIAFTSGGTESDNWAVKSVARMMASQGKRHIVTSVFEHHAVLNSVKALEREGFSATYVGVGADGVLRAEDVSAAIREDTGLVSIILANNEIGTIQPIAEIGAACRDRGVLFHTDAVQAVGTIPIDVQGDFIDLLSLSAHKFHGPKGIGALYIRKGILIPPYQDGGAQERGRRAGTENVPAIVGLGAAIEEALNGREARVSRILRLRNRLLDGILTLPGASLNGDREKRLPGNISAAFQGIQGESLLLELDRAGVAASSASACSTGSGEPSHVLKAIGLSDQAADSSLRLSLSGYSSDADVDYLLEILPPIVGKLRRVAGHSLL